MSRKPRRFDPNIAYHFIARGNNRQTLFRKEFDFQRYLFFIRFLKTEFSFDLFHYCLMSNHVHLLIRFSSPEVFRCVPHRLSLLYAKYFSREYRHSGHVFQDRFKSIPVYDENSLLQCGRYIERNPVSAKIVMAPLDYQWSSHAFYAEGKDEKLVTISPMFIDLSPSVEHRRKIYADFVATRTPYDDMVAKGLFGKYQPPNLSP